ncbi:MAG: biopolymer transporter ExbB [Maritimibacter sp.]|nr:biopolymer transporter ExbB [Maritimibacter sp.]
MEQPDRAAEPHFTIPRRQIFLIATALTLFGVGLFFALPKVLPVFLANLYLNLFILFVFVIGLVATLWQVVQLVSSVSWIRGYLEEREGHDPAHPPRLLAPLAGLLRGRGKQMQVGASSARSILDSVAARIDEERDITRYITNLLIFLGLLGTFYGLATTIPALVDTIRSLAPTEGESGIETFTRLQTGLESQLGGMGTAFSSSLLGLAGSLVVGLIELFATHGQNRFYRELEEWLSSITRFGYAPGEEGVPAAGESSGEAGVWGGYLAEQMEAMRKMFAQADAQRGAADDRLGDLAESVDRLARQIEAEGVSTPYLIRIAEGQQQMIAALEGRADDGGGAHVDAESRMRLRSIDVQLLRILEEMSAGRQESLSELRGDIAALTRAIRQLGGQG